MIPGKRYTPEVVLQAIWRRKWLVLVPFVLITVTTVAVTRRVPNRFRSETLIMVVPQQIPESYVQPTVRVRLEDRLASFNQQILNRTRLEQIVREFDLYSAERQTHLMEDVIERMRTQDIGIQTTGPGTRQGSAPTFRISYSGGDPRTVMRVAERLASLFIEESLRDRSALAEGTNHEHESREKRGKQQNRRPADEGTTRAERRIDRYGGHGRLSQDWATRQPAKPPRSKAGLLPALIGRGGPLPRPVETAENAAWSYPAGGVKSHRSRQYVSGSSPSDSASSWISASKTLFLIRRISPRRPQLRPARARSG